jgi:hypothetical protein
MIFYGVPDLDLKEITGSFPAIMKEGVKTPTHPVFVLQDHISGHHLCPCSSKGRAAEKRYVPEGTVLEMTGREMDRNSYLVESSSFTLPMDRHFSKKPGFMGRVPEERVIDKRRSR